MGEAADVDMLSAYQSALADAVEAASQMLLSTPMPGMQSAAAGRASAEHSEGAPNPEAAVRWFPGCEGLNRLSLQPPPISRPLALHVTMAALQSPAAPRRPADQVTERPPQRPLKGADLATEPEPRPPTVSAAAEAESAVEGVHRSPTQAGSYMEGMQRPPVEAGMVAGSLPPQRPLLQPTPSPPATTSPPPLGAEDTAADGPRPSESHSDRPGWRCRKTRWSVPTRAAQPLPLQLSTGISPIAQWDLDAGRARTPPSTANCAIQFSRTFNVFILYSGRRASPDDGQFDRRGPDTHGHRAL